MTSDESGPTATEHDEDFLAALGSLDILATEEALEVLNRDRTAYLVDTLPLLPDDGIGVGHATLRRIPANAHGLTPHSATWVVRIDYDGDHPDDYHMFTCDTETEARTAYAERVQERLENGFTDPHKQ